MQYKGYYVVQGRSRSFTVIAIAHIHLLTYLHTYILTYIPVDMFARSGQCNRQMDKQDNNSAAYDTC